MKAMLRHDLVRKGRKMLYYKLFYRIALKQLQYMARNKDHTCFLLTLSLNLGHRTMQRIDRRGL